LTRFLGTTRVIPDKRCSRRDVLVMVGLVPTIHAFWDERGVQDVDARHKGEHDESVS